MARDRAGLSVSGLPEPIRSAVKGVVDTLLRITGSGDLAPVKELKGELSSDDAWRTVGDANQPAFAAAWVGGFSFGGPQFCKDENGIVRMRGSYVPAAPVAPPSVIFTLPDGYRPASASAFPIYEQGAAAPSVIQVLQNGNVVLIVGTAAALIYFDSIFFMEATKGSPHNVRDAVNARGSKVNELIARLQED